MRLSIPLVLIAGLLSLPILPAHATPELRPSASSELKSKKDPGRYAVTHLGDGKPGTAWVEGATGAGEGQWLRYQSAEPVVVFGFVLIPGYARSAKAFRENATPRTVVFRIDEQPASTYRLPYRMQQRGEEAPTTKGGREAMECYPSAGHDALRVVLLEEPLPGKTFELRIEEVLAGTKYRDLAVSEWRLLVGGPTDAHLGPGPARILASLAKLRGGPPAGLTKAVSRSVDLRGAPSLTLEASAAERTEARLSEAFGKQARLPSTETEAPMAAAVYLGALGYAFFDRIVTLEPAGEGWRVLGGQAARTGDGEWWELYPELRFDAAGVLTEVAEAIHADGAPGCTDALPAPSD